MSTLSPADQLRFVSPWEVTPHEEHDPSRSDRYRTEIESDGFLRHPLLCLRVRDGFTVVLDGHNRLAACRELRVPHIPVHLLELCQVRLKSWVHLINGAGFDEVCRAFSDAGFKPGDDDTRTGVCVFDPTGHRAVMRLPTDDIETVVDSFRRAVAGYTTSHTTVDRVDDAPSFTDRVTVRFPRWTLGQFIAAVAAKVMFPAGVSRFTPKVDRLLQVEVPLPVLRADAAAGAKTAWLRRRLQRVGLRPCGQIEHYCGPNLVPRSPCG